MTAIRRPDGPAPAEQLIAAPPDEPVGGRAPGTVRSTGRENAIIDAAMSLVGEIGYDRMTMDAVAARARASKATIYRRWNGKAELVAAGLRREFSVAGSEIPNTGSLRGDLLEILLTLRRRMTEQYHGLLVGLLRAMQDDPAVAGLIRAQLAANKENLRQILLRNSAERNETIENIDLIQEVAPAQMMMRILVTGEPVDDAFVVHLIDRVLLPLANSKNSA
ncbi:MAG TPA: TetR/AcrR family transcriptional regulator [Mycobacteriales bacterium]|nr:TetR/AcrR family transcriptional regulator [Mycobacteriales bacterium]